jgi:equilibrative nucleoside transporter 1/2/3
LCYFYFPVASAVLQGGLFGIVGKFSSRYITAVVSGQALGGIFAALAEIASLCLGASSTISAFVYFMVANGMLLLSLVAYIVLSHAVRILLTARKLPYFPDYKMHTYFRGKI